MRGKKLSLGLRAILAICAIALLVTSGWAATEKKLHNFGISPTDGTIPTAGLIFDVSGNLYGTTSDGGDHEFGVVFEMTPSAGGWIEKKLHSFGRGIDGSAPAAGVVIDAFGNLYGTTVQGGTHGAGTVFELLPNGNGGWTEKVLYNFDNRVGGTDGYSPFGGLVMDGVGNLYGTTLYGGDHGKGTVFELIPGEGGAWTEKKLHNFGGYGTDGTYPDAALIRDFSGNLYGTTNLGGDYGGGTVFELKPNGSGGWTETKLHNFGRGSDGAVLAGSLVMDAVGNLYGTTEGGGDYYCYVSGCGTVFELTPNGTGDWIEKKLHNFGIGTDGWEPVAGLILDATTGNLYGTTKYGGDFPGSGYGYGIAFEVSPDGNGGWTERKLHNFGNGTDGIYPGAALASDAAGNFYGTTEEGGYYPFGNYSGGTVFEIVP